MARRSLCVFCVGLTVLFSQVASAQTSSAVGSLSGTVYQPWGSGYSPIADVKLAVTQNGELVSGQKLTTDANGHFSFEGLPKGEYQLIAESESANLSGSTTVKVDPSLKKSAEETLNIDWPSESVITEDLGIKLKLDNNGLFAMTQEDISRIINPSIQDALQNPVQVVRAAGTQAGASIPPSVGGAAGGGFAGQGLGGLGGLGAIAGIAGLATGIAGLATNDNDNSTPISAGSNGGTR
ncbi:MAG: carboxypeptidase-like regulatory domain-containing protein [Planctomycetaceae bacterium]|jgi:hypothetical protein|nr:carboxypeptidase-like regulatory domain-containing protein [Planctomycetaceae bacterium]